MTEKIIVKKVIVGTPISKVTAGSFAITNLGGVDVSSNESDGSIIAYKSSTGNYEVTKLTGDSASIHVAYDSSNSEYVFSLVGNRINQSLIPDTDSAYDLGASDKKWKDLHLSGGTINLGGLRIKDQNGTFVVQDSGGNTLMQNTKFISINADSDMLKYDSATSTLTWNDSDVARTDRIETFHKAIKVTDSAEITSNLTVGGNLNVTGDLVYDDMTADSATFSGSVAIGTNLSVGGNLNVAGDLVYDDMTADSATFAGTVSVGTNITSPSATITNITNTQLTGSQATLDSADITTLKTTTGTITNITNTQLTGSQATFDSANIGGVSIENNNITTGGKIYYANVFSNFSDLPDANAYHGMFAHVHGTGKGYFAHGGAWHQLLDKSTANDSATITNLANTQFTGSQATIDSADINVIKTTTATITNATVDSATVTNLANTQFTGSQATIDSADIGTLKVTGNASVVGNLDVTGDLNFDDVTADSASFSGTVSVGTNITSPLGRIVLLTGDSATITNIANTQFTGSQATFDSANIGGVSIENNNITTQGKIYYANVFSNEGDLPSASDYHGMFAHVHGTGRAYFAHGGVWHKLIDETTTDPQIVRKLGTDSATINNLANTQLTGSQATFDSATITSIRFDNVDAQTTTTIRNLFSASGDLSYDSASGQFSFDVESVYTKANFDSDLGDANTGQLPEGTNLYYTTARADSDFDVRLATKTTSNLAEGSNLYHTVERVQDIVGAMVSSNTESGISVTYEDGDGTLDFNVNDPTLSYTGDVTGSGTMTDLGNTSIAMTISAGAVDNDMLSGSIANAKLTNSTITVSDGSNTSPIALGGTLTFSGTNNEATVAENAGTVTVGLPNDVTISNDLTVSGNLNVTGTTTQTGSVVTDNNFQGLTNANTGNATDFGFYGKYVESSTTKYAGLYYDASTDNTFRLFADTQTLPSTTVNTGATGYADANLVVNNITGNDLVLSGNLTVNGATVTNSATNTTIEDALIELGSGNTGANSNDLGLILERGTTGDNVFLGWDESQDRIVFATTTATGASSGDLTLTSAEIQASRLHGNVTGALTGNADTATTLANARNFSITGGDITANAISFDGSGNVALSASIDATGVDSGTYGSGSLVPVFTVNAKGQIDSAGTVSVAGVSSTSFDSATNKFTINTADGNSFVTTVASRFSAIPDSDLTLSSNTIRAGDLYVGNLHVDSADIIKISRDNLSIADAGGDGSFAYDSASGQFTYTGPSASEVRAHFSAGGDLVYNSSTGEFSISRPEIDSAGVTTLARAGVSVTDAGGDGSLAYNNSTGVFTYTGPSASEVRAHLTANKGLSVSSGEFNIDSANVKAMFSGNKGLAYSDGEFNIDSANVKAMFSASSGVNYSNGAITADQGEIRGFFSAGGDLVYDASSGEFSISRPEIDSAGVTTLARAGISVTDAGGDGSLAYNNGTGVLTYTGPSASEVQAHLTANKGLSVSSGEFNIDSANVKGMFSATGFGYNSGTGAFTLTGTNVLDLIKTVDGASSLLDADKLDGQEGSYYRINVYNASGSLLN